MWILESHHANLFLTPNPLINLLGNVLLKECKKTFHSLAMMQVQSPTSPLLKPVLSTSIRAKHTIRGHEPWYSENTLTMGIAVLKPKQKDAHQTPRDSAGDLLMTDFLHFGPTFYCVFTTLQFFYSRLCSLSIRNHTKLIHCTI